MAKWGLGNNFCTAWWAAAEFCSPASRKADINRNLESWIVCWSVKPMRKILHYWNRQLTLSDHKERRSRPFMAICPLARARASSSKGMYSCALTLAVMWSNFDVAFWMASQYGTWQYCYNVLHNRLSYTYRCRYRLDTAPHLGSEHTQHLEPVHLLFNELLLLSLATSFLLL